MKQRMFQTTKILKTAVCVLFLLKFTYVETLLSNGNRRIIDMSDEDLMMRKVV